MQAHRLGILAAVGAAVALTAGVLIGRLSADGSATGARAPLGTIAVASSPVPSTAPPASAPPTDAAASAAPAPTSAAALPATTATLPTSAAAAATTPGTRPTTTAVAAGPGALVADFTWEPAAPRAGEGIRLVDRSSGGPVAWTWRWNNSTIRTTGSTHGAVAISLRSSTEVRLTVCRDRAGTDCAEVSKVIPVG